MLLAVGAASFRFKEVGEALKPRALQVGEISNQELSIDLRDAELRFACS